MKFFKKKNLREIIWHSIFQIKDFKSPYYRDSKGLHEFIELGIKSF